MNIFLFWPSFDTVGRRSKRNLYFEFTSFIKTIDSCKRTHFPSHNGRIYSVCGQFLCICGCRMSNVRLMWYHFNTTNTLVVMLFITIVFVWFALHCIHIERICIDADDIKINAKCILRSHLVPNILLWSRSTRALWLFIKSSETQTVQLLIRLEKENRWTRICQWKTPHKMQN